MGLVELLLARRVHGPDFYAATDGATDSEVAGVIALAAHDDVVVRRAVAATIPLLTRGEPPSPQMLNAVVGMSADHDRHVRDLACFALAEQWREVTDPAVVDALAARLDDIDRDTRSEALLGLAYRQDPRALPRVRAALSRPGVVWRLELVAAGALCDPDLHQLALRHRHGWADSDAARTADVVCRLTDPDGPGDDVVDGVANLYRRRAQGLPDGDAVQWWPLMDAMLDIAPHRKSEFRNLVLRRLTGDRAAIDEVQKRSPLGSESNVD